MISFFSSCVTCFSDGEGPAGTTAGATTKPGNVSSRNCCQRKFGGVFRRVKRAKLKRGVGSIVNGVYICYY